MNHFFLYDTTNGNIHGSPYLGEANEWTNIPAGCDVLGPFEASTADATVQDAYLHPNHYTIQNGQLVADPNISALQLQEAKDAKVREIYAKRDETILAGFTSANGHQYFYGESDQRKLQGQSNLLLLDPTITSVDWMTKEGIVTHTRDQFIEVLKEAGKFERDQHTKCYTLEAQVWAATTLAQVQAIVW
jgi:hypothetical protein